MNLKILEIKLKRAEIIKNWRKYIEKLKRSVREVLNDAEIYIFGSIVESKAVGASDIDILIVSSKIPQKTRDKIDIIMKIEEKLNLPLYHPFEFHLATPEQAKFYFKHCKKMLKIT